MSQILRQLKIYHLTGMGNWDILQLDSWLNESFNNLVQLKLENGNFVYYRKFDKEVIIILDTKDKIIGYNDKCVEIDLKKKFRMHDADIADIILYIFHRYYNLKYLDAWSHGASRMWNMLHEHCEEYYDDKGKVLFKAKI